MDERDIEGHQPLFEQTGPFGDTPEHISDEVPGTKYHAIELQHVRTKTG